jgi:hypothetical protein
MGLRMLHISRSEQVPNLRIERLGWVPPGRPDQQTVG